VRGQRATDVIVTSVLEHKLGIRFTWQINHGGKHELGNSRRSGMFAR